MTRRDRELLARLSVVNQNLGAVVQRILNHQKDGELHPEDLRRVGEQLTRLGAEMVSRANELDMTVETSGSDS